jgi:hypothetical protein
VALLALVLTLTTLKSQVLASSNEAELRSWAVGQQVRTSSGRVNGHTSPDAPEVSEYLGIPYAQPPVGKLRWRPTEKYASDAVVDAAKFVSQTMPHRSRDLLS